MPRAFLRALGRRGGRTVAVGPHGSVTPGATLRKLGVDAVVRGECEEVVAALAERPRLVAASPRSRSAIDGDVRVPSGAASASALRRPAAAALARRVDRAPQPSSPSLRRPPRTVPAPRSRRRAAAPTHCSFCAKIDFRDAYRRRELPLVLDEIDRLIAQGVGYIYFIDEIFLPQKAAARGAGRARRRVRRADPHRPVEAGPARAARARPAASRSRPASKA